MNIFFKLQLNLQFKFRDPCFSKPKSWPKCCNAPHVFYRGMPFLASPVSPETNIETSAETETENLKEGHGDRDRGKDRHIDIARDLGIIL